MKKIEHIRKFLHLYCHELESQGFVLNSVRFVRNEKTGKLEDVRMTYEEHPDKLKE